MGANRAQGGLFWGLGPQTPFGRPSASILWTLDGSIWTPELIGAHLGPFGNLRFVDPTWGPPGTLHRSTWDQKMRQCLGPENEAVPGTRKWSRTWDQKMRQCLGPCTGFIATDGRMGGRTDGRTGGHMVGAQNSVFGVSKTQDMQGPGLDLCRHTRLRSILFTG